MIKNNPLYTKNYFYLDDAETFDKIQKIRESNDQVRTFVNYLLGVDGKYYFMITEEELSLSDIINPDNVILRVKKYYDDKTITEYMKVEEGNFVTYKTEESMTQKKNFYSLVDSYVESKEEQIRR